MKRLGFGSGLESGLIDQNWRLRLLLLVCVSVSLIGAGPSFAQDRLTVFTAADLRVSPEPGGHGIGAVHYQRDVQTGQLNLVFNTDTLYASLYGLTLRPGLRVSAFLKGEALFAGLLFDHFRGGLLDESRGFFASFVQGGGSVHLDLFPHFFELELSGRRWFFSDAPDTADDMVLPTNFSALEPRLRYTLWSLENDRSIGEMHRHTWRTLGWAFGLEAGVELRDRASDWGHTAGTDPRNRGTKIPFVFRGWFRAGFEIDHGLRLQTLNFFGAGRGEDDLTRARVGGMNPYVAPIVGLPWAAYLPDTFFTHRSSLHVRLAGEHEVGPLVDLALMPRSDALRLGEGDDLVAIAGVGLFFDGRAGPWQYDLQVGYALPTEVLDAELNLTAFLNLGYRFF